MKFEKIEDKVQLGNRGYVRHKLSDNSKCIVCGQMIENYPSGYVYVSVQSNPSTRIHESLTQFGVTMPTDFIDCAVINT